MKLTGICTITSASLYAQSMADTIVPIKHNIHMTLGELAEIQPSLGMIMIEFGHRFYITYYGAKSGNLKLAHYEMEELLKAQKTAEATRPEYKKV